MTAAAGSILIFTLAGIPLVRLVHPSARRGQFAAEAFLVGTGWCAAALFVLSVMGVPWTRIPVAVAVVVPLVPLAYLAWRRRGDSPEPRPDRMALSVPALLLDGISVAAVAGFSVLATAARMWEWDFWAVWGMKARVFFESSGIDWSFLRRPENGFTHPDYPMLLSLVFDFNSVVAGEWDDRGVGLLYPAYAIAILVVARAVLRDECPSQAARAAITLGMTGFALSSWVGLAEGPMIAYGSAGLLLVRRGIRSGARDDVRAGALLAGLAGCTKIEGITLVAALVVGAAAALGPRFRRAVDLWPAAIVLPWLAIRPLLGLSSYLLAGSAGERVIARLLHPAELLGVVAAAPVDEKYFWLALLLILLFRLRVAASTERFILVTSAVQICFFLWAYLTTPYSLEWHVFGSWDRLLDQIAIPLMAAGSALLRPLLAEPARVRVAEAP